MKIEIPATVMALAANFSFVGLMLMAQKMGARTWFKDEGSFAALPPRWSTIVGTKQRFLYWQDFMCQYLGDTIGLPCILIAFFHIMIHGGMSHTQWWTFAIATVADALGFTMMCLGSTHKPDWGYPEIGKVSAGGVIHSLYHGLNVAAITMTVWHWKMLSGDLVGLAVFGGAFYLLTFVSDLHTGKFEPIKYTSIPNKVRAKR